MVMMILLLLISDNNGDNNRSHIAAQDYKPLLAVNISQGSSQGDKMEQQQVRYGRTLLIIFVFLLSFVYILIIISVFCVFMCKPVHHHIFVKCCYVYLHPQKSQYFVLL